MPRDRKMLAERRREERLKEKFKEVRKEIQKKYTITLDDIILTNEVEYKYRVRPSTFRRLCNDGVFDLYVYIGLVRKVKNTKYVTWLFTKYALDDYFETEEGDSLYDKYQHLLDI
jgi:hypothetical protein